MEGNGFNSISRLLNLKMNFVFPEWDLIKKINRSVSQILFLILCLTSFTLSQQWEFMNGPYFGRIHTIKICQTSPNILLTGLNSTNLYKSIDGGMNWNQIGEFQNIYGIAIDPQNPQLIYANTSRSFDGGLTWENMNDLVVYGVNVYAIDPINTSVVYAGDIGGGGIWKSTNSGENWESKNNGIPLGPSHFKVENIIINLQNNSSIFIETESDGLFKSHDAGEHWISMGVNGEDIDLDWSDTTVVYIIVNGQVYKSNDSGNSWTPTSLLGVDLVKVDPVDHNTVYACGSSRYKKKYFSGPGVYKSTDAGLSWNEIVSDLIGPAKDVESIAVNPQDNNEVYIGTEIGVFKSIDSTYQWQQCFQGLDKTWALDFSVTGGHLYAAAVVGIYFYNGEKWIFRGGDGTTEQIEANPQNPNILLSSSYWDSLDRLLFRSTDAGRHWTWTGLLTGGFLKIAISNSDPDIVYAGFWRSNDKGVTWDTMSIGMDYGKICIYPENSAIIYMSSDGIYKSYDSGINWDTLGFLNNPEYYRTVSIDPSDGEIVYVGVDYEGLYKSTDGGYNWISINTGLTNLMIREIVVNPLNSQQIYVGTSGGGVFYSDNGGGNWTAINENLPSPYIAALSLDSSNVYVGYYEKLGVYRREIFTSIEEPGVVQGLVNFQLFQNYPNPFNSTTIIPFEIGQSGHISIKVFNILGEEVITLLDENISAGRHSVSWNGRSSDGREVSSGVYFLKLEAGDVIQSHKMMIIR